MWPQPWQLKHWREPGSFLFEVPTLAIFGPLEILSLASMTWWSPCTMAGRGTLQVPSKSVPGQFDHCGSWSDQECSCPSMASPMASLSGAIWGTGGAVTLPCSCQDSHQLGYLDSPALVVHSTGPVVTGCPSPYLVMGFFVFALCFASSDHELGISGPRIAIEIFYWISNMFTDPMEEIIFEMLLHLSIGYPSWATATRFRLGSLPASWQRREPSTWLPCVTL